MEDHAPFLGKWKLLSSLNQNMSIMIQHTTDGMCCAPLYVHSISLTAPHLNSQCLSLPEIELVADKLRWCRHQKGLLQRDVAQYAEIDRSTYMHYEETGRDTYPLDKMQRIAKLFDVPLEKLLDDYNLFLYRGQGAQIKFLRKSKGFTQQEYARILKIPLPCLKAWEQERSKISKQSWSIYFRDDLVALRVETMDESNPNESERGEPYGQK